MIAVRWIKLSVGILEDEKIMLVLSMPEGDAIFIIWIAILTLAGKANNEGYVTLSDGIPYNEDMLSVVLRRPITIIKIALAAFKKFKMIEQTENGILILNWEKHQNIDGLNRIREQTRLRVQKYRNNIAAFQTKDVTLQVTQGNAIDIDKEKEIDNIYNSTSPVVKQKDAETYITAKGEVYAFDELFELIYKLYPRKTGGRKQTAYKNFVLHLKGKGKKKLTAEQMSHAVQKYAKVVRDKDMEYVQMAQTFFNETIESYCDDEA